MARKPGEISHAAIMAFENIKRNIKARLEVLEISAHKASVYTDHHPTWITDAYHRSAWVSLVWLVDVGDALNVPAHHLMLPKHKFRAMTYAIPEWLEYLEEVEREDRDGAYE